MGSERRLVLTDQDGRESVRCSRSDGFGLSLLRENRIFRRRCFPVRKTGGQRALPKTEA
jgi:hypothetical protein